MRFETDSVHRAYNLRLYGDGGAPLEHSIRCGYNIDREKTTERDFLTAQYALVFVDRGEGFYRDDRGEEFPIRDGTLFQRYPDRKHTLSYLGFHSHYYLALPPQIYELLVKVDSPFIRKPVHHPGRDRGILNEYRKLLSLLESRDESDYFSLLVEMQGALDRIIGLNAREAEGVAGKLEKAAQMLRDRSKDGLALTEIADRAGLGYHHFRKAFAERFSLSPGQYRIHRRIEAAMGLLLTPGYGVSRTAAELGYGDAYVFSAQFKRVTGLSPSRFRRDHGEGR